MLLLFRGGETGGQGSSSSPNFKVGGESPHFSTHGVHVAWGAPHCIVTYGKGRKYFSI